MESEWNDKHTIDEMVAIPSSKVKQVVGILDLCVKMPGLTSAIRAQEALQLLAPYVKETV